MIIAVENENGGVDFIQTPKSKDKFYGEGVYELDDGEYKKGDRLIPIAEHKDLKPYIAKGMRWVIIDKKPSKDDVESRAQMFLDEENGELVIKKDYKWDRQLMPNHIIKNKAISKIQNELDKELDKDKPSAVSLIRKKIDLEKISAIQRSPRKLRKECIQIALNGLDERVKNGESDKPLIRQKLLEKLGEL